MSKVIKRDGMVVDFDSSKISAAIRQAMQKTDKGIDEDLIKSIVDSIEKIEKKLSVDEIQNIIENKLMTSKRKDVAKKYINYRQQRDIARQSKFKESFLDIINTKNNDITKENANMNPQTPAGMMMKFASEMTKPFVHNFLLCDDIKEYMDNNLIYQHDCDYYPTKSLTCVQHPMDYIFKNGFKIGHGGESRPPKRIETAAIQTCISMETVQNEMHGGQAIPAFDYYLAPFVKKTYIEEVQKIENLTGKKLDYLYNDQIIDYLYINLTDLKNNKEITEDKIFKQHAINNTVNRVHQSMESFIHNMNTIHSRGGNQVVFSSINYGTDTTAEGRCIIREILNCTYEGVGNGSTAIFPIQIWKLKKGISYLPEDRNYDLYQLACKVTARRFFPNFLNLDATFNQSKNWKDNDPQRYIWEVATMGCRTRLFEDKFGESTSIGRGNLSFTSINLPRIAIEAGIKSGLLYEKEDGKYYTIYNDLDYDLKSNNKIVNDTIKIFYEILDKSLIITAKQLDERYKFQATAKAKQFPLLMSGLWMDSTKLNMDDLVEPVLKHGTLGIGFIGLAECLICLFGKHHGESDKSQQEGLKIIKYMKKRADDFAEIYNHNYSILATPAESLSGTFVKKDKKEYGIIDGITDKDYYTNSNHIPVYYKCSAKHKAEIEGPYHDLTRGGHIFYVEIDGDATKNPLSIQHIVDIMTKNNIGYGSINHTRSRCEECGFESADEFNNHICPKCNSSNTTYLQRITGYLVGTTDRWNSAKKAELEDRVKHT